MVKAEIEILVKKLIALGEDAEEMQYWIDIYNDLPEEQQQELFKNFSEELKKLETLK